MTITTYCTATQVLKQDKQIKGERRMKITMATTELKNVIEKMYKALPKKQNAPIFENFCIEIDSNNLLLKIKIMEYKNNKIIYAAAANVKIKFGKEIVNDQIILEDTKALVKSFKYFKDDFVSFDYCNCATALTVQCGNKTSKVNLFVSKGYPEFSKPAAENTMLYNADKLKRRFDKVKYAIPKDSASPMRGVHFDCADMVACDGCKISVNTDSHLILTPVTISQNAIKLILDIFGKGDITISQNEEYFMVANGAFTFLARKENYDYIDYRGFFATAANHKYKIKINKEEFADGLEYLRAIASDENSPSVKMHDKTISVEQGVVEMGCTPVPIAISFNPSMMLDALRQFDENIIVLHMNAPLAAIMIKNETNSALIMPKRT